MLDKITGKTPVAAYVSPVVSGKVLRSRGGETRVLRPGYVKPKHRFDYQQAVERLPGEDPARLNDPAYRRVRNPVSFTHLTRPTKKKKKKKKKETPPTKKGRRSARARTGEGRL